MADQDGAAPPARIMIVDDDPIVRRSLGRVLSDRGYTVIQADSAEQGLALLGQGEVSLVIADMNMPGMDGLRFLLHVRAQYPTCASLILTASQSSDLRALTYSGFDAKQLVRKTIGEEDLLLVVERTLQGRVA